MVYAFDYQRDTSYNDWYRSRETVWSWRVKLPWGEVARQIRCVHDGEADSRPVVEAMRDDMRMWRRVARRRARRQQALQNDATAQ